jgi:hypothetical protein
MSHNRHPSPAYQARSREVGTQQGLHPAYPVPPHGEDEHGYTAAPYPAALPPAYWEPQWADEPQEWEEEYYDDDYLEAENGVNFNEMRQSFEQSAPARVGLVLLLVMLLVLIGGWAGLRHTPFARLASADLANVVVIQATATAAPAAALPAEMQTAVASGGGVIAPFFAPSVRHWEPRILEWANQHGLDPNMVATVMQIESCGDPAAVSIAGAQGLFQVMPFHFERGEVMTDPDTNAYRGMKFMAELLVMFDNNPGLSLAGYNGGPGNARKAWEHWPNETQRYYRWGLGIYNEATAGQATSATLDQWLNAGGASLCRQASQRLGLE